MAYKVIIKEEAQSDTVEAYMYYEQKQQGLGERFLMELFARYTQIAQNPQHYSYVSADKEKTFRDVKIKGFPYVVIYDFIENEIIVYAVHNCYKNRKDD